MTTVPPNLEGHVLGGRYRLLRRLGQGGMGAVYAAIQLDLQRRVAIKMLHAREPLTDDAVRRFRREALAAAELGHPNIVQVTDFQSLPPEPPFLVMEMLEGESLEELLQREPVLRPERATFIATQILAALAAAHAARIVHRDIKPANVFLTQTPAMGDLAKVLDFGIAKIQRDAEEGPRSTAAGGIVGTPAYMAPEQARGQEVDARTDVYAAGAVLFEMLTGRRPFGGTTSAEVLAAIVTRPAPPLAQIAPWVDARIAAAVDGALAKDPAARPQSALEMLRMLAPFARASSSGDVARAGLSSGAGLTTRRDPPLAHDPTVRQPTHALPAPRASPTRGGPPVALFAALGALAVAATAVAGGAWMYLRRAAPSAPPSLPWAAPSTAFPPLPDRSWASIVDPLPCSDVGDATEDFAGAVISPENNQAYFHVAMYDGATFTRAWESAPIEITLPIKVGAVGARVLASTDVHKVTVFDGATGKVLHEVDTGFPILQICAHTGSARDAWLELGGKHEALVDVETGALRAVSEPPKAPAGAPRCRYLGAFGKGGRDLDTQDAEQETRQLGGKYRVALRESGLLVAPEIAPNGEQTIDAFDAVTSAKLWSRSDGMPRVTPHVADVIDGRVYVQDPGTLECVDGRTGKSRWKASLGDSPNPRVQRVRASTTRVYVVLSNGLLVLDATTGRALGSVGVWGGWGALLKKR